MEVVLCRFLKAFGLRLVVVVFLGGDVGGVGGGGVGGGGVSRTEDLGKCARDF